MSETPKPLTPDERADLARIARAATPGPWFVKLQGHGMARLTPQSIVLADTDSLDWREADYQHIAAANPDTVLRLLAQLDAAEQALIEIIAQLVWCENPQADDLESVRYAVRLARAALTPLDR